MRRRERGGRSFCEKKGREGSKKVEISFKKEEMGGFGQKGKGFKDGPIVALKRRGDLL